MKVSSSHIRWLLVLLPCAIALCSLMGCKSVTLSKAELYDHTGRYALAADSYYTLYRRTSRKKPERRAYLPSKLRRITDDWATHPVRSTATT